MKIFDKLRENFPNLFIVLSSKYSIDVPGFISIKWDDDLRNIVEYLLVNMEESLNKILDVTENQLVSTRNQAADCPQKSNSQRIQSGQLRSTVPLN